jgi:hypothetical protein
MSIRKLQNRIKKIEGQIYGVGGNIIPKVEQLLIAKARTESEANNIFENLKDRLHEKYNEFSDENVMCIWCKDYSTAG